MTSAVAVSASGSRCYVIALVRSHLYLQVMMETKEIKVFLTQDELYQAAIVGAHRHITCLFSKGARPGGRPHYDASNEWNTSIEGCCGELAFAKWCGKYWTGGSFNAKEAPKDVGNKQVRHTVYKTGRLIIYPHDNPDDDFVLVTGKAPFYNIRGWVNGLEIQMLGKTHPWWNTECEAGSWWVPQESLRPMPHSLAIHESSQA